MFLCKTCTYTCYIIESYDATLNELTLECVVAGRPKIIWFKDNYNISNNRYSYSEDYGGIRRLIIRDPVSSDSGKYTCRAEENNKINEISLTVNTEGYDRPYVKLEMDQSSLSKRSKRSESSFQDMSISRKSESINPDELLYRDSKRKPLFSTQMMNRTATENSSIKLTCQIIGVDTRVQWYRSATRLDGNPRYLCRFQDGLATLEIFSVNPEDSGNYTCSAINSHGETSCSASLKVFAGYENRPMPPIFTRAMKGRTFEIIKKTNIRTLKPTLVTHIILKSFDVVPFIFLVVSCSML